MSKSEALQVFARENGLLIRFWSNERGHMEEPHVHVLKPGDWELWVRIDASTREHLVWRFQWRKGAKRPESKLLADLAKAIDDRRQALLDEWARSTMHER